MRNNHINSNIYYETIQFRFGCEIVNNFKMSIKFYSSFFPLSLLFVPSINTNDIELDCYITEEHYADKACVCTHKMCIINVELTEEPNTRIVFTNANEENITSVLFTLSRIPVFPKEVFDQFPYLVHLHLEYSYLLEIGKGSFIDA